jgi:2-phosphoglycerate kinase
MMTIPRVVLIGGPPYVGKSAVARCIAARYEYGCIAIDDIAKAVGSLYSALTRNKLDPMDGMDWREYFTTTPVDLLLDHAAASRERIWPAIDKIVRTHSTWDGPLVMEGYALWPEQVMAAGFTATGAVWLTCNDLLLESRIRSNPDFYRGAVDEEALISNFLRRSSRYNELMLESAAECSATVITVLSGQSVKDIADLCVSALTRQSAGTGRRSSQKEHDYAD